MAEIKSCYRDAMRLKKIRQGPKNCERYMER